jgi:hypothetical protein
MRLPLRSIALLFLLSLSTVGAMGAGDGLTIKITNDSSDNILLTVYDQHARPPQKVMASTPVYGSASLTVSISADSRGKGHLSWTAVSMDPNMRMCGRGDTASLNDGDTISVHADGDCAR